MGKNMEEQTKDTAGLKRALNEARDRRRNFKRIAYLREFWSAILSASLCGAMGIRRKPLRCSALHRAATLLRILAGPAVRRKETSGSAPKR